MTHAIKKCFGITLILVACVALFIEPAIAGDDMIEEGVFFFASSDTHITDGDDVGEVGTRRLVEKMNELPGKEFPFGGIIEDPAGFIIAGDLIDSPGERIEAQWAAFEELFHPAGDALFEYPVFEGVGNHDMSADYGEYNHLQKGVIENNKKRPVDDLFTCDDNYHYSWEWSGVRFVQLHAFPGSPDGRENLEQEDPGHIRLRGWNDPKDSLGFLQKVLKERVEDKTQPIILTFHYGFNDWGKGWWSERDRDNLEEVIDGYNVVLMIYGHSHAYYTMDWRGYKVLETGATFRGDEPGVVNVMRIIKPTEEAKEIRESIRQIVEENINRHEGYLPGRIDLLQAAIRHAREEFNPEEGYDIFSDETMLKLAEGDFEAAGYDDPEEGLIRLLSSFAMFQLEREQEIDKDFIMSCYLATDPGMEHPDYKDKLFFKYVDSDPELDMIASSDWREAGFDSPTEAISKLSSAALKHRLRYASIEKIDSADILELIRNTDIGRNYYVEGALQVAHYDGSRQEFVDQWSVSLETEE